MAAIGKKPPVRRVSPLKPGLRGARNWATAQMRAASYSRKSAWRLALSIVFIFGLIGFVGLWLGGFLPDARQATQNFTKNRLISMGFVVDRVDVMGEGRLRESDIRKALGVRPGDFLFDLDLEAAQNRVENINWVERAIVRRLWPDRIVVQIIERKPYALWQKDGNVYLVDNNGLEITLADAANYPDLPLIVGADAPNNYVSVQEILSGYPDFNERLYAMVHHNTGRWDLIMHDGDLRVQLPTGDIRPALDTLLSLHDRSSILDREIAAIDLRLPDRISLTPLNSEPA